MKKEYFLGLDLGSNSVGYAVTSPEYEILKFNKKAMWGCHMFEGASQSAERRSFRSARRRLERKKQRIQLARELFAKEIAKIDEDFYRRLDESALQRNDKTIEGKYSLFNDVDRNDVKHYKKFPTIHHLIMHLIKANEKQDIRLIYLATAFMLAHRGHFLIEVDKDDLKKVISFDTVYDSFVNYFIENEIETNWIKDLKEQVSDILKRQVGIKEKQNLIKKTVFNDKRGISKSEDAIVKAICGGKFKISDLFEQSDYKDLECDSISLQDGDFDDKLTTIGARVEENELELIIRMKAIFDWSLLSDILMEKEYISQGKIVVYEQHKKDLKLLKKLIKKYLPNKYDEVFRYSKNKLNNYVAYSGNFRSASNNIKGSKKDNIEQLALVKTDNEKFCAYLKKLLKDVTVKSEDQTEYNDLIARLDIKNAFMPKQVNIDNGVIPYQLYRYQLKHLLENAAKFHPFLLEKDDYGLTVIQKLLSIIEFRIPYYVGPLNNYHGKFSWIERKADGRILPWNFSQKVDLEKSEEAFIRKMTSKCSYLAGEDVLCKNSLLYSKFMLLNEINNIKVDENAITVECKQKIYLDLFANNRRKITKKRLKDWLVSNKYMEPTQEVRGVDDDMKSNLRSYHDFKRLLISGVLDEEQVEEIIARISMTTDKRRLKTYLKINFPTLSEDDINYIASIKYKDYGRLSNKFLTEIHATIPETGEYTNIMGVLWNTNYNLMQLL